MPHLGRAIMLLNGGIFSESAPDLDLDTVPLGAAGAVREPHLRGLRGAVGPLEGVPVQEGRPDSRHACPGSEGGQLSAREQGLPSGDKPGLLLAYNMWDPTAVELAKLLH